MMAPSVPHELSPVPSVESPISPNRMSMPSRSIPSERARSFRRSPEKLCSADLLPTILSQEKAEHFRAPECPNPTSTRTTMIRTGATVTTGHRPRNPIGPSGRSTHENPILPRGETDRATERTQFRTGRATPVTERSQLSIVNLARESASERTQLSITGLDRSCASERTQLGFGRRWGDLLSHIVRRSSIEPRPVALTDHRCVM
jgi:hypothetical protein